MKIHEIELYRNSLDKIAESIPVTGGRVLVTGASGMIGSCLVDAMVRANQKYHANYQIYALSRNEKRLKERFSYSDDVHIIAQDISEQIQVDGLDYILHTASAADPRSYTVYPAETILTNVQGAKSVLDYCEGKKTRALLTSTFEVYGKLDQDEYSEEDFGRIDENQLRSVYPESKRVAELLFRAYHAEYGVDCLIARLPSVYGPTMSAGDNKAHAEFIRNAIQGEKIVLKSTGLQKRTYSYVMDIVDGLFFLLFRGNQGEVYNVANPDSVITIADLAKMIATISGTDVMYNILNEKEQSVYSRPQNIILKTEKIKQLGWQAKYDLFDGISDTLKIASACSEGNH